MAFNSAASASISTFTYNFGLTSSSTSVITRTNVLFPLRGTPEPHFTVMPYSSSYYFNSGSGTPAANEIKVAVGDVWCQFRSASVGVPGDTVADLFFFNGSQIVRLT
jgi:hypothetical protein